MSLWFRKTQVLDSETMREIAENAGVEWDYQTIDYRGRGISYADGDSADLTAIQDAAESMLGYPIIQIDEPDKPETDEE